MRLARFELNGQARVGILDTDAVVDLNPAYRHLFGPERRGPECIWGSMEAFLRGGEDALSKARAVAEKVSGGVREPSWYIPAEKVALLPPIERPGKMLAVDYNHPRFIKDVYEYLERKGFNVPHWEQPKWPWFFVKLESTIVGPGGTIFRPKGVTTLDAEGELAIVIGKTGESIPEEDAFSYVAGYTLFNDISDRATEFTPSPSVNHRLFFLGKNSETFGPLGPCIYTPDEMEDVRQLVVEVLVNGKKTYDYGIGEAIFPVEKLVSFFSFVFRLEPGDVIAMGSGGGCGGLQNPSRYLQPGDRVSVRIPGVGQLDNIVEEETA